MPGFVVCLFCCFS